MHIKCPNCTKSFSVNDNLIPSKGRLLQCGNCNNKWFFKKKEEENKETIENNINKKIVSRTNNTPTKVKDISLKNEDQTDETDEKLNQNIKIEKKIPINYFKLFFLTIISLIALIILIDTFKSQISYIFPSINIVLDNLYETLTDINLFFKDLIR